MIQYVFYASFFLYVVLIFIGFFHEKFFQLSRVFVPVFFSWCIAWGLFLIFFSFVYPPQSGDARTEKQTEYTKKNLSCQEKREHRAKWEGGYVLGMGLFTGLMVYLIIDQAGWIRWMYSVGATILAILLSLFFFEEDASP